MKVIIALRGKNNSGKTSSFRILAEKMIREGFNLGLGNYLEKREKIRGLDFWQIFEKNDTIIGLVSSGDKSEDVMKFLEALDKGHGCTLILCACRSYGGTVQAVESKEGFQKIFEYKERESDERQQRLADEATANMLLQRVYSLI
jgi:hypothetical protein